MKCSNTYSEDHLHKVSNKSIHRYWKSSTYKLKDKGMDRQGVLPLNTDYINENTVASNLIYLSQNSLIRISWFTFYALMGC